MLFSQFMGQLKFNIALVVLLSPLSYKVETNIVVVKNSVLSFRLTYPLWSPLIKKKVFCKMSVRMCRLCVDGCMDAALDTRLMTRFRLNLSGRRRMPISPDQ